MKQTKEEWLKTSERSGYTELAKEYILAFLQYELEDGKSSDAIRDDGSMSAISFKPPVMTKYALLVYKR